MRLLPKYDHRTGPRPSAGTMSGMTDEDNSLEAATVALAAAQGAPHAASRNLSAAIVAAYQHGEPVARIAERTGKNVIEIRNLLAVTGAAHRG